MVDAVLPVVDGGRLVGIVTSRDMRFEKKLDDPVRHIMTKKDKLVTVREGGPSRDWLNPDLGYLVSPRARAKVRSWFNAQISAGRIARGRELVEKLLQREGRTAMRLEDLAAQLGFASADALFEEVGKDEYSLRNIEVLLHPPEPAPSADEVLLRKTHHKGQQARTASGGVLVVGVDSLLTQLSRCCKPAPPLAKGWGWCCWYRSWRI